MAKVKFRTDPVEVGKIPITCINVCFIQKSLTASPATKKSTRLGEATTQKVAGFIEKKITLLQVSIANGEFNISVHILRQKFDQYVGSNIPSHFEQWVIITKEASLL